MITGRVFQSDAHFLEQYSRVFPFWNFLRKNFLHVLQYTLTTIRRENNHIYTN